jgi:small subunit ribosomal protein S10
LTTAFDASTREIVSTAKRTGAQVRRPIPLPTRIEVHGQPLAAYRRSRASGPRYAPRRVLDIVDPTPQTVDADETDLAAGVDVEIKPDARGRR